MNTPRFVTIALSELRLIARNKTVLLGATLFPLGMGAFLIYSREDVGRGWTQIAMLQIVFFTMFTVYLTITTTLATRRNDLFLKRLRSGESSDVSILAGLITPVIVLLVVQLAVVTAAMLVAGAPLPVNPLLLAAGSIGFVAAAASVGILTGNVTPSAVAAQMTTMPFITLAGGSAIWALFATDWYVTILPGGALTVLITAAFGGTTTAQQFALAAGALLVWTIVPAVVAFKTFRWEPRR